MAADGTVFIDSKLDSSGIEKGLKTATTLAAAAVAAVGAAMATAGAAAVKLGTDFYAAMSEVQAISGATGNDFQALIDKAKEMGATTKFSASESAEALKYMAMAGWDAEQMIAGLPGVMNLAAASGEALGTVSDIVTDALTAMGLKAEDAGHFADVLAQAATSSNTNVGMMGQTFKYAAPLAGALGYSVEDLSVAIGLMANSGIKGEQAGTALRAVLTRLAKPTAESQAAMDALGISMTNADGSMKPLSEVITTLRESFSSLTAAQQAEYAAMLGGQEAMSGLLAIVNASDTDFQNLTDAINDSSGAAERMAKVMQDNLAGDMEELGGALETLGIQIFEAFNEPLREAAKAAAEAVGQVSEAFDSPEMRAALRSISEALSQAIQAVAEWLADAIPSIVSGIASLIENFDRWAAVLGIVTAAVVAFKAALAVHQSIDAVSKAKDVAKLAGKEVSLAFKAAAASAASSATSINLFQLGVGVMSKQIDIATAKTIALTAAKQALNLVMAAAPWALAAAGVAALAVGIISVVNASKEVSEEAAASREQTNALTQTFHDLNEEMAKSKEEHQERVAALAEDSDRTRKLAEDVIALSKNTELTTAQLAELKIKVSELNNLVPGLSLAYDEQTASLNMTEAALLRLNGAREAENALVAAGERYSEIIREKEEATLALAEAEAERERILAEIAEKEAEREQIKEGWSGRSKPGASDYDELTNDINLLKDGLTELDGKTADLTDTLNGLNTEEIELEQTTANATKTIEANEQALKQQAEGAQIVKDEYDGLITKTDEVIKSTQSFVDTLNEQATAYEAGKQAIAEEAGVVAGLIAQIDALSGSTELTTAQQGELLGTTSALVQMMPELSDALDEQTGLLDMSTAELEANAKAWEARRELAHAQENFTTLTLQLEEAERELSDAEAQLAKIQEKRAINESERIFLLEQANAGNEIAAGMVAALAEADAKLEAQELLLSAVQAALTEQVGQYGEKVTAAAQDVGAAKAAEQEATGAVIAIQEEQAAAAKAVADAYEPLKQSVEETISSSENLVQALADEEAAFQQSLGQIDAQVAKYKELATELTTLAAKENKTGEETARMNAIMGQLNGTFPALGLKIDQTTGKLNTGADAIHTWLDGWGGMEKSAIAGERLTQVMDGQISAADALTEVESALVTVQEALAEKQAELNELTDEDTAAKKALIDAIDDLGGKNKALLALKELLLGKEGELTAGYQTAAEAQAAAQLLINEAIEDGRITKEMGMALSAEYAAAMDEEAKAAEESAERQKAAQEALQAEMQQAYERYASMTQSFTDKIKLNTALTVKSAEEVMAHNGPIMKHWTDNMNELGKKGLDEGFMAYLRELGPAAAAFTQELVDLSGPELQAFVQQYVDSGQLAMDGMEAAFSAGGPAAVSAANAIIAEMAKGFLENAELDTAMGGLVENALSAANTAMEGKTFVEVGTQIDTDIAQGITDGTATTDAAATKIGETLTSATGEVTAQDFATNVGKVIDDDIAGGITDNTTTEDAAKAKISETLAASIDQVGADNFPQVGTMVDENIAQGVRSGSASPTAARSLVMRIWQEAFAQVIAANYPQIGMQMDEGMAQGLYNGESIVTSAARDVARAAYEAAKAELDINSPSGKFEYLAEESIEGYVGPFKRGAQDAGKVVSGYMDAVYAAAQSQQLTAATAAGQNVLSQQQTVQQGDTIVRIEEGAVVVDLPGGVHTGDDYQEIGNRVAVTIGERIALQKRYKGVI